MPSEVAVALALQMALPAPGSSASTAEIEARMELGLSGDPAVAVERCRTALLLRAVIERDVRPVGEDRWERTS